MLFSEAARYQIEFKKAAFQRTVKKRRFLAFLQTHLTWKIAIAC